MLFCAWKPIRRVMQANSPKPGSFPSERSRQPSMQGKGEAAAAYEIDAALREAVFGNADLVREHATAALALSEGRDVQSGAAQAGIAASPGYVIRSITSIVQSSWGCVPAQNFCIAAKTSRIGSVPAMCCAISVDPN